MTRHVAAANTPGLIGAQDLATISTLAKTFQMSGLFSDTKNEAQAIVKMLAGRELGLGPFEAMRDINIIQGKTTLAAAQVAARIQQSGGEWEFLQFDEKGCKLRFSRNGKVLTPDISFMLEDARKLGIASKDNYIKQARTMLFWRALTMGARMLFPGVFGGPIYTPDELRGGMIDEPLDVTPESPNLNHGGVFPAINEEVAADIEATQRANYLRQRDAKIAATDDYTIEFGSSNRGAKVSEAQNIVWLEKHLSKHSESIPEAGKRIILARIATLKREYAQKMEAERAAEMAAEGWTPTPEEAAEIARLEALENEG
jgi:hypothetical protein